VVDNTNIWTGLMKFASWTGFLSIDEDTRSRILGLHDPADNLEKLDTEDAEQVMEEKSMYSEDTSVHW